VEQLPDVRELAKHLRSIGYTDAEIIEQFENIIIQQIQAGGDIWDKVNYLLSQKIKKKKLA
jgi:hypothetical protein